MKNQNVLVAGIIGLVVGAFLMMLLMPTGDITYTYVQREDRSMTAYVTGAAFVNHDVIGGATDRKSFSEILDIAKRDFHTYYLFEQNGVDATDIKEVQIFITFRDSENRIGAKR